MRSLSFLFALLLPSLALASGFKDVGDDLEPAEGSLFDIQGQFRLRGEWLNNFDLDHGLTPSGEPLFPGPVADPDAQSLTFADMRLRTDLAFVAPTGGVGVKMRLDVFDNLALGSTPNGPPLATKSQVSPAQAINVERLYGEVLLPFGLLAAGRMGADWGLGMLANGGDCDDCDSGDAADRIAFITPVFGHIFAIGYDFTNIGSVRSRKSGSRVIDFEPADDVRTLNFAVLRYFDEIAHERRRAAGKSTVEYGAYLSHQWQEYDIPASYIAGVPPGAILRDYSATAIDGWFRVSGPWGRVELEAAVLTGEIGQASLIKGLELNEPVTTLAYGAALQSDFGSLDFPLRGGLDLGFASGDAAPGFGAYPGLSSAAQPGDLDGLQFNYPSDTTVDNFAFHPDYRIDRILFRELIGTVTDAVYIRPHLDWRIADLGPSALTASLFAVASMAVEPNSTPGGERPLALELDPTIAYGSDDGFRAALEYAVLIPFSGLDNRLSGQSASAAQMLRLRLHYVF
ncbi:MAG: TIGR04551 family protein [Myxococcota bacterium]|jgi:uncharacterized protein (TIGR04551 family)|nr:TIGR04551 family protein [Myxococcota bacterium]